MKDEWNGCKQSAKQQVNELFTVATIYLGVHEDAHSVQRDTRWLKIQFCASYPWF